LAYSLENRFVELITLTNRNEITKEREEKLEGLFPDISENEENKEVLKRYSNERPYKFNKPCVFLSARVHPGEV